MQYELPPWLDHETSVLIQEAIELLAARHPDLVAVVLYGSVARHEERPLDDLDPSDVDLLAIFDSDRRTIQGQGMAIIHTLGMAKDRHLNAPREVNVLFASRTLQEWDPTFVANVAHDGIVLYQRGPVPALFAA